MKSFMLKQFCSSPKSTKLKFSPQQQEPTTKEEGQMLEALASSSPEESEQGLLPEEMKTTMEKGKRMAGIYG